MEKTLTCTGHQYTRELGPCVPVVNTGEVLGRMYNNMYIILPQRAEASQLGMM